MKKAVDTIVTSFQSQLEEHNKKISELESELTQRKELKLKLQGALEGFALLDEESKKPENQPIIQLDDEDEEDEE
tara:strand:- start:80 stop:304 length:225 start_codon:yes stop_codon:yes gene_type:complete